MSDTDEHSASGNDDSSARPRSLDEVNRSVSIPTTRWWRRLIAFMGPAYMVSVGYMDPGNWATDLAGGSQFGYTLLWVLAMSNLMAILLQTLSARLGLVTGRDLAQACREEYPAGVRYILFALCEVAIAACDMAEVIGTAIGLNLLFGIPVFWGVLITAADVLLLLMMQRFGIRKIEAFIILLVAVIGACFIAEVFLSKPSVSGVLGGFVPHPLSGGELYIAIGILGATVMPHNLYLHSALVQSRDVSRSRPSVAQACKYNLIDSVVALNGAFFINAAILVVAAATFYEHKIIVEEFAQAPELLQRLLGSDVAKYAFALGLLCAGQSSTVTGTLAGQITMEGFLNFRMRAWLRRLLTRMLAITPAVIAVVLAGEKGLYKLLILSQVVLSLQLSFAVVPLVKFTSSKIKMGPFANKRWVWALAWAVTLIIIALNGKLAYEEIAYWVSSAGSLSWLIQAGVLPATGLLGGLLIWMIFRGERPPRPAKVVAAADVA
ncbi:MAG: divalent metal cation transporter, partial [Planctomycetaceae bacterium]